MTPENIISVEKINKYIEITSRALDKIRISEENPANAKEVFEMAKRYFEDAKYFREKGKLLTAFAAINYAHGWLDAGARLKLFDVGRDSELFAVD